MKPKYAVNERVRELMKALGYKGDKTDPHEFGQILLGVKERTEKFKNAYSDKNGISTDLLLLITRKIVNDKGQKVNGHWLLTGEGSMFLDENGTSATNSAAGDNKEWNELREDLKVLRALAISNAQTILNLTGSNGGHNAQQQRGISE